MVAWDTLMNGNVYGAITQVYTDVMGNWFYALIIGGGLSIVYFKTQDIGVTAITLLLILGSVFSLGLLPIQVNRLLYTLVIFGVVSIIYLTFKKR